MSEVAFSDIIVLKTLDADLHTKMDGVEFSTSAREVVTVGDVENCYAKMDRLGLDS